MEPEHKKQAVERLSKLARNPQQRAKAIRELKEEGYWAHRSGPVTVRKMTPQELAAFRRVDKVGNGSSELSIDAPTGDAIAAGSEATLSKQSEASTNQAGSE